MCHYVELNENSKFDKGVVRLVDNGTWALYYGKSSKDSRIRCALNTGNEFFFLDKNGVVINKNLQKKDFEREDIARFSKMKSCQVC